MPIVSTTDDLSTTSTIPINVMTSTSNSEDTQLENGKTKLKIIFLA